MIVWIIRAWGRRTRNEKLRNVNKNLPAFLSFLIKNSLMLWTAREILKTRDDHAKLVLMFFFLSFFSVFPSASSLHHRSQELSHTWWVSFELLSALTRRSVRDFSSLIPFLTANPFQPSKTSSPHVKCGIFLHFSLSLSFLLSLSHSLITHSRKCYF